MYYVALLWTTVSPVVLLDIKTVYKVALLDTTMSYVIILWSAVSDVVLLYITVYKVLIL